MICVKVNFHLCRGKDQFFSEDFFRAILIILSG